MAALRNSSKSSEVSGQDIILDTTHSNDVVPACKPVSARWRDLGTRLGVLVTTLDSIEATHNGNVERCLPAVIDAWLRRAFGEVHDRVKPTWKSLCVALSHIDRALAERLAEEHDCGDVKMLDVHPPAFLPKMCGCGKCTVIGWRTGRLCQNYHLSKFPKLLVVDPRHSLALHFCEQNFARHATLCKATRSIISQFQQVVTSIWEQLYDCVEAHELNISKITRTLRSGLGIQLPMFPDLDSLQNHCHSLHVSWYNFRPLHLLVTRVLTNLSLTLLADWNSYLARFKEYCSARNLKDFKDVYFRVEEENIFLLEVDDFYDQFTLSDIEELCTSLGIALGCPSVHLHLVTVRGGSLIIYLYYSYSDYLTVFQSLTTDQLKMISQIKAYRILSLTDLHDQFKYDNFQRYTEAPPQRNVSISSPKFEILKFTFEENTTDVLHQGSYLSEGAELWRKQSQMKDIELSRTTAELNIVCTELLRNEESITTLSEEMLKLKEQLHLMEELKISLSKEKAELEARPDFTSSNLQSLTLILRRLKEIRGKPIKTVTGLNQPRGVTVCDNGDIVVAEYWAHCITIVNKEGKKVRSFGTEETKEGQFINPCGVAISNDNGYILVTDEHRLQKLTFDGVCVQSVGSSERRSGHLQFNYPRGIAVHHTTGLVFVADSGNNRIQVFNSDLTYAHSITLNGDKQFKHPNDVSLDSDGCVYVAELHNYCITKLTTTGEYITSFGSEGSAPGQLYRPTSLTINNNLVYVSEYNNNRVSVFDTKGTFLHCFGKRGSGEGEFNEPYGITTDTFGNLYFSDSGNNRLVVY